jgi:hypothetical protein
MMRVPFVDNELLLGAMELFTGEGADFDVAETEDEDATRRDSWPAFTQVPLALTGLPELGQVAAEVPCWYEEPVYAPMLSP